MKNLFVIVGFCLFSLFVAGFVYSPHLTLNSIDQAIKSNDAKALKENVNIYGLRKLVKTIIEGKLKLKKDIEKQIDSNEAWLEYGNSFKLVDIVVDSLISPKGFPHLLRGELDFVEEANNTNVQPVFADTKISFDSLLQAHTLITNESGLEIKVILRRTGVYTWMIDTLEFPLGQMLEKFTREIKESQAQ